MQTIGLLGAAGIAVNAMIRPVRRRDDVRIGAVASRSSARDYADRHGIERAYDSYDALLADPDVDLVYNALPPSLHAEWTIAALRAGKNVLCEKPFTMTAAATVRASMVEGVPLRSALTVDGERGRLEVDNIVFPSAGHSIRIEVDGIPRVFTVAGRTTYDHQLEAVLAAFADGVPLPTEGADPIANMAVIDAVYAAAGFDRSGWS